MAIKKVLLIRLDKIGDLICTLPVDQILDQAEYDVTWIIQKGLGSVVDLGVKNRKYLELDKSAPAEAAKKLRKLSTSVNLMSLLVSKDLGGLTTNYLKPAFPFAVEFLANGTVSCF